MSKQNMTPVRYILVAITVLSTAGCMQQESPLTLEMKARSDAGNREKVETTDIADRYLRVGMSEADAALVLKQQAFALYRQLDALPSDTRPTGSDHYLSYLNSPSIPFFAWTEYWVAVGVSDDKVDFIYSDVELRYF